MKKILNGFVAAVALTASLFLSGCVAAVANDGTNVRKYVNPNSGKSTLWAYAEGYDIAVWGSWQTVTAPIASVSDGADGGVRLTSIERPDDGTYFGVNMCAGSGSGATADIDGKGFTQIHCYVRGTVDPKYTSFYIINGAGASGSEVGKTKNLLDFFDGLSETEWKEITVTGLTSSSAMSAGLVIFCDNDGCEFGDWIEVKSIDFQDDSGNSVIPVKK